MTYAQVLGSNNMKSFFICWAISYVVYLALLFWVGAKWALYTVVWFATFSYVLSLYNHFMKKNA